jgi:hypothetical protein
VGRIPLGISVQRAAWLRAVALSGADKEKMEVFPAMRAD